MRSLVNSISFLENTPAAKRIQSSIVTQNRIFFIELVICFKEVYRCKNLICFSSQNFKFTHQALAKSLPFYYNL